MNFYYWAEALENFTPDLLTLRLSGVEFEENSMLWNDHYRWIVGTCEIFEESQTFKFSKPDGCNNRWKRYNFESNASTASIYIRLLGLLAKIIWQHRRIQNINSQRAYRQKRADELRAFKSRAIAADETSMQVNTNLRDLELLVTSLKNNVQQLEADDLALRTSLYSMAWRKSSFHS
ncbi:hypothetical protein V1527DRAFT_502049 [Lipomyces starkeyi]